MKNSRNRLQHTSHLSRHSHDVHAGFTSSLATGPLVPQYFDILGPGDSIYYRTVAWARLQDMVTAFKGEIDIHLDYFFVPLQMLYTPFGQVFAQTDDFLSSLYANAQFNGSFPLFKPQVFDNTAVSTAGPRDTCKGYDFMRLCDALDANPYFCLSGMFQQYSGHTQTGQEVDNQLCEMPYGTYWSFLAYQAIYQKFYRNDEFEKFRPVYNVDYLYNTATSLEVEPFILRYCQRPKDYFTNLRVSPLMSAVNNINYANGQFPVDGGTVDFALFEVDNFLSPSGSGIGFQQYNGLADNNPALSAFDAVSNTGYANNPNYPSSTYLNTANIRALFALDKYQRIYGAADKTYDDQILAHFGIKIPHDVKHDLTHLKHYHMVLQASPVFSTANTSVGDGSGNTFGTLGQVGGQGECSMDSDQEKFTAPVHGVFMCIAYAVTKPRYVGTFSKLHIIKDRLGLPIPEFDKLGAQPQYAFEYDRYHLQSSTIDYRIGWQNRYQEFKQKYNRASFVFEENTNGHLPVGQENIYSAWVLGRKAFAIGDNNLPANQLMEARYFFESPYNLNQVMTMPYDGTWNELVYEKPHLALETDPIIFEFACYAKKVSWMSETGDPDL